MSDNSTSSGKATEKIGHTPGPWRARIVPGHQDSIPIEATDAFAAVAHANGFPCTDEYTGSGTSDPKANARLIAAAPDLLAACRKAQGILSAMAGEWPGTMSIAAKSLGESISQAIAKVEGRSL